MDVTSSTSIFYRSINFVLSTNTANMVVATDPANLLLANAQSNVTTSNAVTNITIDVGGTNIPLTGLTGTGETRPNNIALLPVIRY
jgi:hypothetical protein